MLFARNRGARFVDRINALIAWIKKHQNEILSILGLVVVFLDDGSTRLVDEDEAREQEGPQRDPTVTPDGEPVEDFTKEADDAEG